MAKTNFATSSRSLLVFLVVFFQLYSTAFSRPKGVGQQNTNTTRRSTTTPKHGNCTAEHKIKVAKFDFGNIAAPFIVASWVLLASLLKLGFHMTTTLSKFVPESCMIILLGVALGGLSSLSGYEAPVQIFSSRIFFLFLLPPIVLEAGYFLHTRTFFDNIGTILLFAVVGTLFNTFTVGLTLWASTDLNIDLLQMLLFSCLIAAVDPVAVLAVFEEVHINETLYILVFGESLLNDAVTVVLYRVFKALVSQETVEVEEVLTGVAAFFVVSIGGLLIGMFWAILTAFLTKFTDHVRVLEPIFVVCMSYMSYLTAELFHFSGIISIVTCAILMRPYVEANISQKSRIPVKYFLKMASSLSETIIFMLLGVILFDPHRDFIFDAKFVFMTIFFISLYRCLGVVLLSWLANTFGRLNKLGKVDQFVMAYGGLRGAVAFSLATLIDKECVPEKPIMETTAIAVVFFTVFVQGTTIKPIVGLLNVKRAVKRKEIMLGEVNDKMLDHLLGGVQDIIQHRGHYYWKNLYQYVEVRYLRRWLIRHQPDSNAVDETLLMVYRKISRREAMDAAGKLQVSQSDPEHSDDFEHVVKDRRRSSALAPSATGESRDDQRCKDMSGHVQLALLLEKQRKGTIHRFSRNNVLDETDTRDQALRIRRRSQTQVPRMISRKVSREEASDGQAETSGQRKPRRKHGHAHSRRRTHDSKKHQKVRKKLSDIAESPKSQNPPESLGQASPPVGENDEEAEMSSASDAPSEERDLLPKLADLEPSSPTLDTHFTDIGGPLVTVDTHTHGSPDGISETVM